MSASITNVTTPAYDNVNVTNNDSSLAESDASNVDILTEVIGAWLCGVICVLGVAGNGLSFVVLLRAFGNSPMFYVLRATSLADGVFLLCVFVLNTLAYSCPETGPMSWCSSAYIPLVVWPVLMTAQMITVWLAVLVSAERFVAICYPLRSASLCTLPRARRCVFIMTITSVIYCIPRYFEYTVSDEGMLVKGPVGEHELYRYVYSATLYSLFLFFLPLLLIAFLNIRLVIALQRGKRQWRDLQQRQRKEQSVTIIPLTIVATFFLCGTPSLAVNVIEAINPLIAATSSYVTFMVVANLLVVINSASNFVIYYLLGRKFRQKLVELCCCCCRRPQNLNDSYRLVPHSGISVIDARLTDVANGRPSRTFNCKQFEAREDLHQKRLKINRSRGTDLSPVSG